MRLRRKHESPHFQCTSDYFCDGLDEIGVGHVCMCSCRDCSLVVTALNGIGRWKRTEICICADCDALACGLHRSV